MSINQTSPLIPPTQTGSAIESIRDQFICLRNAAAVKLDKAKAKVDNLEYELRRYEVALESIDGRLLPLVQRYSHLEQHELFDTDSPSPRLTRVS